VKRPSVPFAGVEHLLRDVKDATVSTLAAEVSTLASGLSGLKSRLLQIQEYLSLVIDGKLPVNHDILYQLQVEMYFCPGHFHAKSGCLALLMPVFFGPGSIFLLW
jgi:hypothetical protein